MLTNELENVFNVFFDGSTKHPDFVFSFIDNSCRYSELFYNENHLRQLDGIRPESVLYHRRKESYLKIFDQLTHRAEKASSSSSFRSSILSRIRLSRSSRVQLLFGSISGSSIQQTTRCFLISRGDRPFIIRT